MIKNFGVVPNVRYNRARFEMPHGVKTTMNVGTLYPISCVEVLPGDSFKCDMTAVARVISSFVKPVIDNVYMDVYHFYCRNRLVFNDFEKVFGNPDPSQYTTDGLVDVPVTTTSQTVTAKTVADYLGLPPGTVPKGISILPFRHFANIYDKWFRNENIVDEMFIQKGSIQSSENFNNNAWAPNNYTGKLPKVGKRKDYFTSCLPATQKGQAISISVGASTAPILPNGNMSFRGIYSSSDVYLTTDANVIAPSNYGNARLYNNGSSSTISNESLKYNSGLIADLSSAYATPINDIRFAFQLQKMLELDARGGSRYFEYLNSHFGVSSPDAIMQIPEYLGGGRIPINVQQVEQTSATSGSSPLANVAGYSLSNGYSKFSKGFNEHGFVFTVACIRTMHTYQQGIAKFWSRKSRNDFYDPLFSHLGEQPVYSTELYVDGTESSLKDSSKIFGYNEAWSDYRYIPSTVTGGLRSTGSPGLDIWHFADYYASRPVLSQSFIEENPANIDRTVSVPSTTEDNFLVDFYFKTNAIRVMPVYSTPGLVDHTFGK